VFLSVFKCLKLRLLIYGLIVVIVMINPKLTISFVKISIYGLCSNVNKNK
jgi:hypothetical protein